MQAGQAGAQLEEVAQRKVPGGVVLGMALLVSMLLRIHVESNGSNSC